MIPFRSRVLAHTFVSNNIVAWKKFFLLHSLNLFFSWDYCVSSIVYSWIGLFLLFHSRWFVFKCNLTWLKVLVYFISRFFVEPHILDSGLLEFDRKWRYFGFIKSRATSSIANAVSKNQWCGQNPASLFFQGLRCCQRQEACRWQEFHGTFYFYGKLSSTDPTKAFF